MVLQRNQIYEVSRSGSVSKPLLPSGVAVDGWTQSHTNGRLLAARVTGGPDHMIFFDRDLQAAYQRAIKPFVGDKVSLINADDAYDEVLIYTDGPDDSGSYYWIHLTTGQAELIQHIHPLLTQAPLGLVKPFYFTARDGLPLSGIVTLPPGGAPGPLPAVVMVHGLGDEITGEFSADDQVIASRGFAVINIDYRDIFTAGTRDGQEGLGELGAKMQTDLADGVQYLAGSGVIDAKRVCIVGGGGYAGYAAVSGVVLQKGLYRCAVAVNPVVDLHDAINFPSERQRGSGWDSAYIWRKALGQARLDQASLRALSPIDHVEAADAPILLICTTNGDQCGNHPTFQLNMALQQLNKPVQLIHQRRAEQLQSYALGQAQAASDIISFISEHDR